MRPDGTSGPEAVLAISTLGAPQRRLLRRRRRRSVTAASPEPVPTTRATVVAAEPFADRNEAAGWLAAVRDDDQRRERELRRALAVLDRALHAHRVARADPHARDAGADQALVTRIGYGTGDEVVEGRYADAWELPRAERGRARRSMEAPEERFAALLGGRERIAACEELTLRARMDLDAGRDREAALQARVALEALLAELDGLPADRRGELEADRPAIGDAANAALHGQLPDELRAAVAACVERMESALRGRRLGSAR